MNYSEYQEAIFDWIKEKGDGVSEACAGSGKTTTLVEINKRLPSSMFRCAFAFNTHIADEFTNRGMPGVTANAFGWRAVRNSMKPVELVKGWKTSNILKNILPDDLRIKWQGSIKQLVSLGKAALCMTQYEFRDRWSELADAAGVEFPAFKEGDEAMWQEALFRTFKTSIETTRQMDWDDQIYMVIRHHIEVPSFDMVMIDETQDYAPMTIALMTMASGDRLFWVGDSYQACYRFRGADPDVMRSLQGKALPLSYCYRCGSEIVKHAQQWVPDGHILPAPGAISGSVEWIDEVDFDPEPDTMVTCRMTAPLVQSALKMIRRGRKAYVKGRDIGQTLIDLIDQLTDGKIMSVVEFDSLLQDYKETQCKRLHQLGRDDSYVLNNVEAIRYFYDMGFTSAIKAQIKSMCQDESSGVMHSTIHKAKGSEADVVYCIRPDKLPHKKGDLEEERRLQYIQATRAKTKLVYVRHDKNARKDE